MTTETCVEQPKARSILGDERGAILVIGVFFASLLVGGLWYMVGIGEAAIYREQMRAAVDAVAFGGAAHHALGMNMIAMINVVMAAVMAVMVLLMTIFIACIMLTILAAIMAAIPFVDVVGIPFFDAMMQIDNSMFKFIEKVQGPIFETISVLNTTEAVVAVAMPWVSEAIAMSEPPNDYEVLRNAPGGGPASYIASISLVPTKIPYFSDKWGENIPFKRKLTEKTPGFSKILEGREIEVKAKPFTALRRYGLPVEDDSTATLCDRAARELVDMFELLLNVFPEGKINGWISDKFFGRLKSVYGNITRRTPWLFCSGVDLRVMINAAFAPTESGGTELNIDKQDGLMDALPWLKEAMEKPIDKKVYPNLYPMKVYTSAQNGNAYFQVWAKVQGNVQRTFGARTAFSIPTWTTQAASQTPADDPAAGDFAEAEFYYDCRGAWSGCRDDAMWNMNWVARLRRYHHAEIDLGNEIAAAVYDGLDVGGLLGTLMDAVYPSMAATPLKDAGKTEARKRILDWFHASATVHDNPYGLPDSRIYH